MQLSIALQGDHHPAAAADRRRLAAASSPARCWCPTPAVRNLIREGKTHQIYSVDPDRRGASACRRWTPPSRRSSAPGKITQRLAEQRSSTPEELRRLLGVGGQGSMAAVGEAAR